MLLTVAALVGVVWGAVAAGPELVGAVLSSPSQGEGFWPGLVRGLYGTAEVVVGLLVGLVGLVVVAALLPALAAPFNDALSEAVERRVRGRGGPPFSISKLFRDAFRSIAYEVGKLAAWVAVVVPILLLSIPFPVVGPVTGPTSLGVTWVFFGLDHVDWVAARRDATLGDRVEMVKKRFRPLVGLGIGVWILIHVPFLNLLFMPAAVAGGTLLFLDLEDEAGTMPAAGPPAPSRS